MPLYAVVVLVVGCTLGPILSISASVMIAKKNTANMLVQQEEAKEAARQDSRRLVCAFFAAQLDAMEETPPTTDAGRNIRKTNLEFYSNFGCQPPRK